MKQARTDRALAACCALAETAWLPGLPVHAAIHSGPFGFAAVQRETLPAPAVLATAVRVEARCADSGEVEADLSAAAFCMAKGPSRGEQARMMAEAVLGGICRTNWARSCAGPIRARSATLAADPGFECSPLARARSRIVSADALDRLSLAVWVVEFEIRAIALPDPATAPAPPAIPSELYLGWAPQTGREHAGDYERVLLEGK